MKKIFLFIITLVFLTNVNGQVKKMGESHSQKALNCDNCHSCSIPTKENPCLRDCPRESIATTKQKPEEGPDVIVINKLKGNQDIYKEVTFSHRLHAEMSEMSGGCVTCHHYNPPGKIIGCDNCHNSSRKRDDVNRPDLKGAYHRQCMDCHREWSGGVECSACHQLKTKDPSKDKLVASTAKKSHAKLETPEKITFKTPKAEGKTVNFFHKEHIDLFGLDCQSCHSNDGCVKCHDQRPASAKPKMSVDLKHKACSSCHDTKSKNNCVTCHNDKDARGFNHLASTGFNLSSYHSKLSCVRCHTTQGKFIGLSKNCNTCHGTWTKEKFNHKVTGLVLNEIHIEFDCESCHTNPTYAKPECATCHDDYTFPKFIPGKKVKR
jgi:hypothetical protein